MKKTMKFLAFSFTIASAFFTFNCDPAYSQAKEESDVTPEVSQPKIYNDNEFASLDISKLKIIADSDSIGQKSPLALYCLAGKYSIGGDLKSAAVAFKKLIEKYPRHYLAAKACLELAGIHAKNNEKAEEISALKNLSENYPEYRENTVGLYRLASIYRDDKKLDDMRKTLDTLEVRFGSIPEALPAMFMSANEYLKNYNSEMAIKKFDKILEIKEITPVQKANALNGKAAAYTYMASSDEAAKIYGEITKIAGLDAATVAAAQKSIQDLAKAPKTRLVKIDLPAPSATGEVKVAGGRVKDDGPDTTSEVKVSGGAGQRVKDDGTSENRIKD